MASIVVVPSTRSGQGLFRLRFQHTLAHTHTRTHTSLFYFPSFGERTRIIVLNNLCLKNLRLASELIIEYLSRAKMGSSYIKKQQKGEEGAMVEVC